ncbi:MULTISPECIES: helix-turn-helix domain-containing protein [Serratia]|uniref:helix-turn-helix domain-containing protein n=1 Tax=Serratia proteamaculans TaxID=28151 RepID=UPI000E0E276F
MPGGRRAHSRYLCARPEKSPPPPLDKKTSKISSYTKFLNQPELAEELDVDRTTIGTWVKKGFPVSKRIRVNLIPFIGAVAFGGCWVRSF